jgi:CHASE2 domain-containing sensor protein
LAKSSSSQRTPVWSTDWFVGVAVVVAAAGLHLTTDLVGTLERRFYDFSSTSTSRQPSDRIAVIAIDDQSIANIGRWPWPRDVHAKLIDELAAAKAKTVVYTAFFLEPQVDPGLQYIRKIKDVLAVSSDASATSEEIGKLISQAEVALDTDQFLLWVNHRARPTTRYPTTL